MTANYLQNRLPTGTREKTPYEYFNLRKPNLKDIRMRCVRAYTRPKETEA